MHSQNAGNNIGRRGRYSPDMLTFGKEQALPGVLTDFEQEKNMKSKLVVEYERYDKLEIEYEKIKVASVKKVEELEAKERGAASERTTSQEMITHLMKPHCGTH